MNANEGVDVKRLLSSLLSIAITLLFAGGVATADPTAKTDFIKSGVANGAMNGYITPDGRFAIDETGTFYDRLLGTTDTLLSSSAGNYYRLSNDGRYVSFISSNVLTPGDTNGDSDCFRYDRQTSTTVVVNVDSSGNIAGPCFLPYMSADGRYIGFTSSNFANNPSGQPSGYISSVETYVRDLGTGLTTWVNTTSSGLPGTAPTSSPNSQNSIISPDGRFVVFTSTFGLTSDALTNGGYNCYLKILQTGTIELISKSLGGTVSTCSVPGISQDGRYVVFSVSDSFTSQDTNSYLDIYLNDRQTNTIELISVSTSNNAGNDNSNAYWPPSISSDGRFVAFQSSASDLVSGDTNNYKDVFVRDRILGKTVRASISTSGVQANDDSDHIVMTDDGRYILFFSKASNLVDGSTASWNVLIRDRGPTSCLIPLLSCT